MKKGILIAAGVLTLTGLGVFFYVNNRKSAAADPTKPLSGADTVIDTVATIDEKNAKLAASNLAKAKVLCGMLNQMEVLGYDKACENPLIAKARQECTLINAWKRLLFQTGYRKDRLNPKPIKL